MNRVAAFEIRLRVDSCDIDGLGHVNNIRYLHWVQDVAIAHWRAIASADDQARFLWVVLRHEIDYRLPVYAGDELTIRTWVGKATRLRFERHTEIAKSSDGRIAAKALTIWCPVDADTKRPTPVNDRVRAAFSEQNAEP